MGKENNVFSEMAKTGGKFVGNVLFLPVRATIYVFNPRNWFNSWERVKHDTNNALGEIVGIPGKPYRGPVRMLQSSRDLGIEAKIVDGKLIFSAPKTLMGDIQNLSQKQVDGIEEKYAIIVDRRGNSIGYSVNIEEIVEEVQSRNKELSKKEVKTLVIKRIAEKVNFDLVGFAKITGVFYKLCQTAFLIQLNFQSARKENVKLRHGQCPILYRHCPLLFYLLYSTIYLFVQGIYAGK